LTSLLRRRTMGTLEGDGGAPGRIAPAGGAIAGASGAPGVRLLQAVRELELETHRVVSEWARRTIQHEMEYSLEQVL